MKKYLVSTTTHKTDGTRIDNWEGAYIEAECREDAEKEAVEWEENMLLLVGAYNIEIDGTTIWHEIEGEERYTVVHID